MSDEQRKLRRMHSDCVREIEALEAQQHRPLRALAMNPGDEDARAKLDKLEAAIATLREEMRGIS